MPENLRKKNWNHYLNIQPSKERAVLETSTVFVANFYCKVGIMDNLFICIKAVNTCFDTTAKYHCSSFVATIVPPSATDFGGFTKKGNVVFH